MASRPTLDVWLYDTRIGGLSEPAYGKTRFDYSTEAEERFRPGSVVFSISMPINVHRRPRGDVVRAFFHGLLPEGEARGVLCDEFSVRRGDDFGLLSAIGRDCAGAVVLVPTDPVVSEPSPRLDPLSEQDLERLIADLSQRPLGADTDVRVSLAGAQEKLLLAQTPDGSWARPVGGAPSTHILKPQDMRFDSYAASEAFCLDLARRLGLTDVDAYVLDFADRPVLVVSRYDRQWIDNRMTRVHQEDACQALGIDCSNRPGRKYQAEGGPGLATFARLLADFTPRSELFKLLALSTFNVVVGNADAHAKNLSILHPPDGTISLAPAYDITPTTYYTGIPTPAGPRDLSDKLGMWINDKRSIHEVAASDLISEGAGWGLSESEASRVVGSTLDDIGSQVVAASRASSIPQAMLDFVAGRASALIRGDRADMVTRPRSSASPARSANRSNRPSGLAKSRSNG